MPKAASSRPLSCLFAINKPSGPLSMTLLNRLQPLFASSSLFASPDSAANPPQQGQRHSKSRRKRRAGQIKMGQGGTLDPLADGVLVVGVNNGTKHLAQFLECTKEYTAVAMLGASTDSYDAHGKVVATAPWKHVTRDQVAEACNVVKQRDTQIPPVYSALKMDGQPLHWYARQNIPLPRPVEPRPCKIHELRVIDWRTEHAYDLPKEALDEQAAEMQRALEKMVREGKTSIAESKASLEETAPATVDVPAAASADESEQSAADGKAPVFEIKMTVGSGTYVRSIVQDIGIALGSAAFVVKLTRTRQGAFALGTDDVAPANTEEPPRRSCIEWSVFEKAIADLEREESSPASKNETLRDWEQELLNKCQEV